MSESVRMKLVMTQHWEEIKKQNKFKQNLKTNNWINIFSNIPVKWILPKHALIHTNVWWWLNILSVTIQPSQPINCYGIPSVLTYSQVECCCFDFLLALHSLYSTFISCSLCTHKQQHTPTPRLPVFFRSRWHLDIWHAGSSLLVITDEYL